VLYPKLRESCGLGVGVIDFIASFVSSLDGFDDGGFLLCDGKVVDLGLVVLTIERAPGFIFACTKWNRISCALRTLERSSEY